MSSETTVVAFRIAPNASESEIRGINERGEIRVGLQAPPVDGKANTALIAFLAKTVDLGKKQVTIIRGERSRQKWIAFQTGDRSDLLRKIGLND